MIDEKELIKELMAKEEVLIFSEEVHFLNYNDNNWYLYLIPRRELYYSEEAEIQWVTEVPILKGEKAERVAKTAIFPKTFLPEGTP